MDLQGMMVGRLSTRTRMVYIDGNRSCCAKSVILCSDVKLFPLGPGNALPRNLPKKYRNNIEKLDPMKLDGHLHIMLMDAAGVWEGLNYMEDVACSDSEKSASEK